MKPGLYANIHARQERIKAGSKLMTGAKHTPASKPLTHTAPKKK
jgi:hypothetical protein